MGGAFSKNSTFVQWFPPYSAAVRRNIPNLANTHMFVSQGGAWSPLDLPLSPIQDLWGWSTGEIWAPSYDNQIFVYDGNAWSMTQTPIQDDWLGVWGTASNDVFVMGAAGNMVRWIEGEWLSAGSLDGTPRAIGGLVQPVVVGDDGLLAAWEDGEWVVRDSGTTNDLFDVWGNEKTGELWVVGEGGIAGRILEDAVEWENTGTDLTLRAVHGGPSGKRIVACGDNGTLLSRDIQGTWKTLPSGTPNTLLSVWAQADGTITATGHIGTIVSVNPDTDSVLQESLSGSGAFLHALWFQENGTRWIGAYDALFFGPLMEIPHLCNFEDGGSIGGSIRWGGQGGCLTRLHLCRTRWYLVETLTGSLWWTGPCLPHRYRTWMLLWALSPPGQECPSRSHGYAERFSMESFNYFDVFSHSPGIHGP